jgi:aspartate aminotransferase-like enzyme
MHKTNFDLRLDIKSYAYRNDKTVQDVLGDKASTIGGRTNDEDYEAKVAKVKVVLEDIKAGKTVKEAAAEHNMTSVGVYKNVKWLSYIAPEYVAEYKTIVDSHRSGIKK